MDVEELRNSDRAIGLTHRNAGAGLTCLVVVSGSLVIAMKILHIISAPSAGGIETYVKDLSREMISRGLEVYIGFLECAEDNGTSVAFQEKYVQELDAAGIKYFFIGSKARRWFWQGMSRVRNFVREHEIDLYHSHLTYGILFGSLARVPKFYTHHSVDMRVHRVIFSMLNPLIDQVIGISEKCKRQLADHVERDIETIFNGIDINRVRSNSSTPRRIGSQIDCIAVGRICVEKNYELLVGAIAGMCPEIRSRLLINVVGAGSARETSELEELIRGKGLTDTVRLLGNRMDVPKLLSSSQLFLMSSSSEGLPIALIEASASGLPCIVTDVGGCREVIEYCDNGIVVEPGNSCMFADAIAHLLADPEAFTRYSENGLRNSGFFSIERACDDHIGVYRRFVPNPKSGRG